MSSLVERVPVLIGERPRWWLVACIGAGLMLAGCQPETAGAPTAAGPAGELAAADPDDLVIVECLLPGRVRQMGTRLTYLEPRRPTRTDRRDCEIRGGEYVALDRADYTTAMAIWLDAANAGDTDAMTYVGEIHERGLGRPADPAAAANWYQRAADEGHARAQINLANLYAQGRGVPRDEARARALYASATDLPVGDIVLTSAPAEFEPVLVRVDERAAAREREIAELRTALDAARREREEMAAQLAASPPPVPDTDTAPADAALAEFLNATVFANSVAELTAGEFQIAEQVGRDMLTREGNQFMDDINTMIRQVARAEVTGLTTIRRWQANHPDTGHLYTGIVRLWTPSQNFAYSAQSRQEALEAVRGDALSDADESHGDEEDDLDAPVRQSREVFREDW